MLKYFLNTFYPMQTPLNSSEIPERALGQVSKKMKILHPQKKCRIDPPNGDQDINACAVSLSHKEI